MADASPDNLTDVVLLGGSISALMAACHLKLQMPSLEVMVIGPTPEQEKRPIVGESTVEPTAIFFQRIGLGPYLKDQHTVKNGLSYYHKLAIDDPADRRYTVHAPEQLHHLARQLDRPRFDSDLRQRAVDLGVQFVEGKVDDVALGARGQRHQIQATVEGEQQAFNARWVIDCTGRRRLLGKQVTNYVRPAEQQRNCFWFRLADFDSFVDQIDISRRKPWKYDLWYTTHHFLGRGNWIWGIPLQSTEYDSLISIGITYRPDLFPHPMKSIDDFLAYIETEHPALAETVRSGTVIDQHTYGNYLYWAKQVYSPDGWFLLGDAAHAVDPLYSTGLTMTVIQIEQIAEIIATERRGEASADMIGDFEQLWMTFRQQRAEEATQYYECMHDPFAACMRRYWAVMAYFNAILPLWFNGLFHHHQAAPVLADMFARGNWMMRSGRKLIEQVSRRLGSNLTQADFDRTVDFDWVLNHRFDCPPKDVPRHFARLLHKRALFRWNLLKLARFRCGWSQLPVIALELLLSKIMPGLLRRKFGDAVESETPFPAMLPEEGEPWMPHPTESIPAPSPQLAYQESV